MGVETGYLLLADISGYTGYLAETELAHAHEILQELLGEIVDGVAPPLQLAEIEGDAVFAHGAVERGETVLEAIESTYVGFLRRRDVMEARTTCPCNACRRIGSLDLKFLLHHGEYALQELTGTPNPIGSDVNLIHRLLKNSVAAQTGWHAYVLLTQQALDVAGVQPDGVREGAETYEHLGDVPTWSYDLEPRARALQEAQDPDVPIDACDWATEIELPAEPSVVWSWLNDTSKLPLWTGDGNRFEDKERPGGRTGPGAVSHCYHGAKNPYVFRVIDWLPFSFLSQEFAAGPGVKVRMVYELEPANGGGTRLRHGFRFFTPVPGPLRRKLCRKMVAADAEANLSRLRDRLDRAAATKRTSVEV